jgi:hypothetical protein
MREGSLLTLYHRSLLTLCDLGIRKALRASQPDARGSGRSFAEVALATPTMQAVQESLKGLGTRHEIGVWVFVTTFGESFQEYKRLVLWGVSTVY